MKTIGLIGGMSWENTVTYYQIVNKIVKRELAACKTTKNPGLQDRGFFAQIYAWEVKDKRKVPR